MGLPLAAYPSIIIEMMTDSAVPALAALAHDHRLAVFRLLVQAGEGGVAAGEIARALGIPASTLSFHLAQLQQAGLVSQRREGRSLLYAADFAAMRNLIAFLTENCCAGEPCAVPSALPVCPADNGM